MKHVVVINQFALPRTEGGGTRHIELFGRLAGWAPLIIAGNRNHNSQRPYRAADKRFRLVVVPEHTGSAASRILGWILFAIQGFAITVTRRRLDLVYGSTPHMLAPLAGLLAARVRRVPFVLEVRDLWPESIVAAGKMREGSAVHKLLLGLERYLAQEAAIVICVTGGWEQHFADLGVSVDRLVVVPNGTDPADFHVAAGRDELRIKHDITGFTAIFSGAHGPMNGLDFILDAAAKLPDVNFLLVGDGRSKPAAMKRSRDEGLGNVDFRAPVPKQDLAELLKAADVGIHAVAPLAVLAKGMSPNKLFDYMAAGLPVVSNAGNALRDVIKDNECGRLVPPHELRNGVESVRRADECQRKAWGKVAVEVVTSRFSRKAAAQTLVRALDRVR